MNTTLLIIIVVGCIGALALVFLLFQLFGQGAGVRGQIRNIVDSQRQSAMRAASGRGSRSIYESAKESRVKKKASSILTLDKKLK